MAGEYTGGVVRDGIRKFIANVSARSAGCRGRAAAPKRDALAQRDGKAASPTQGARPAAVVLHRLPGAADLRGDEARRARAWARITSAATSAATCSRSCRRSMSAPRRWATASAPPAPRRFNVKAGKRAISMMGDGGFWHNGLTSGVGNAVFNKSDNVLIIVDNGYSAATGGQDIPSSRHDNASRCDASTPIEKAVRGVGVKWVRTITPHLRRREDARHF